MSAFSRWPDIGLIVRIRRELGVTQQKLSKLSGVPQPIISRIERGIIKSPSYETVRRIFEALESSQSQTSGKRDGALPNRQLPLLASDLMNRNLVSVRPTFRVKDAWSIMREAGFSQLPVIDEKGRILGGISERSFPSSDMAGILEKRVEEVMGDPFPIVGANTRMQTLVPLLRTEPAILIVERGRATGIVTPYDLMENAFAKSRSSVR